MVCLKDFYPQVLQAGPRHIGQLDHSRGSFGGPDFVVAFLGAHAPRNYLNTR